LSYRGVWTWSFLVLAILYVCFGIQVVTGKCSGQWAIHACAGANGKRSDTQLPPEYRQEGPRVSLEKLLLTAAATQDAIDSQRELPVYRPQQSRHDKIKTLWKKLLMAIAEKDDAWGQFRNSSWTRQMGREVPLSILWNSIEANM